MSRHLLVMWIGLVLAFGAGPVLADTLEPYPNPVIGSIESQSGVAPPMLFEPGHPGGSRLYGSGEYVTWWLRRGYIPPLLTTSSFASKGLLGQSDTQVLFGDERLETRHDDRFIGTRFRLGWWLDNDHTWALEGTAWFLERDSTYFKTVSDGTKLLARPYINALDGSPGSVIIAGPTDEGLRNGGFNGYSRIELFGQELNLVANLCAQPASRLDLMAGARFLQMRDRLDLTATGKLLPDQAIIYGLTDHYRVYNAFYGGQLGLRGQQQWGPFSLDLHGLVALGATQETMKTFGDRITHTPTERTVQPFGLTVLPGNTGRFKHVSCDTVTELGINLGYQLGEPVKLFGGYTLLLWNSPLRAGDQVDLTINPNQITGQPGGPSRPALPFRDELFWAQGLNVGLAISW